VVGVACSDVRAEAVLEDVGASSVLVLGATAFKRLSFQAFAKQSVDKRPSSFAAAPEGKCGEAEFNELID
jgi:uncharacterized low-complexity protein